MNFLIVGSGGREHSIVQKLARHQHTVHAAPGNDGMEEAKRVDIPETDFESLVRYAEEENIDWTIIGPEAPLSAGIVDVFREKGQKVFGPDQSAAVIEGSKHFAKQLMNKHGIPTAAYGAFTDVDEAHRYIREQGAPIVVKADGLAAGKGVIIAESVEEAEEAVRSMLEDEEFGEAGREVVVEEYLEGKEFSLMAFVEGDRVYPMLPARDHKKAFDGDEGPNTGGMGAFSPVPGVTDAKVQKAVGQILQPAADAMVEEGRPFQGILYAGLIETADGVKVIEFNARFGDPETQVVLPLLENDLARVITDVTAGKDPSLEWKDSCSVGVVLASAGYPGTYEKGKKLPGHGCEGSHFTYAGVTREGEIFRGQGGRVLMAGATGADLKEARQAVQKAMEPFDASDCFYYRKDIAEHI
ncbi:phosphoribosylamine--glycine ligase [Salimicrobium salexigens]|uniref:Phosphoribosylamine--glycine ligase n=1 Tax=Salimicrobium salexigens TaxID=908941 RepID=A0ABY1KTP4_9BACI|nr:phosphoribosylamine--glycine ligase [Salimicrobium salexigens]SIS76155.1 phosphoribosylamine--glycine ligase [Salimicrobium salexigens]